MPSSRIELILKSMKELREPIRVHGASPASRAYIVARLIDAEKKSHLILCSNDEQAAEFAGDLEFFLELLRVRAEVLTFSTWDQSPYSPIAPSLRTRLGRSAVLHALHQTESVKIVVASIASAAQATLPREVFSRYSISLKPDDSVESREALIARLTDAGYLKTEPVEDPGSFSVRGDIIDVFPPYSPKPFRIELFGDVIEKIREFDPATQRTSGDESKLDSLLISPAREVLINAETVPLLRQKIKERADNLGIPRSVRDPVLASIHPSSYAEHSDVWAPFAYAKTENLFDHLRGETGESFWPVIWSDELSCEQEWDRFTEEQTTLASEALESKVIAPEVSELFSWNSKLEAEVEKHSVLYLDRLELIGAGKLGSDGDETMDAPPIEGVEKDPAPTTKHQVFVKSNSDLARGSRHSLGELEPKFRMWIRQRFKILALASTQSQLERMRYLLEERSLPCQVGNAPQPSLITLREGFISEGFRWPAEGWVIVTEEDILGARRPKKARKSATAESGSAAKDWSGLQALSDLAVGDAVVHVDHGIGRYQGIVRLDLSGAPSDFLLLEYASKDKLYLPVYRLNVIQKYVASGEHVALDKLGAQQFAKAKEKVRDAVKKLAIDLVQLYAERKIKKAFQFSPRDAEFREFEAKFPFDETPDQLKAVDDILRDMESGQVSDRLVCGDVGYGKTEVAMRAAFRAVSDGKQVAVLVPTTILAYQHEQSFKIRFKDYPLNIESVSRFKTTKEQKITIEAAASGKIDVLIGTHRLLSRDVRFRDLGLVIVDEEHRFGVEHKEKLKTLKINTHVITLTATPIPRTLHMALAGLREISLINTPPVDRLPIRTYISKFDESLIARSIEFELNRGGQVFFLHNRVQTIYEIANKIRELVPSAQVGVGHGQMGEGELEEAMIAFYQKKTNVLVCTTIIESGLDLPSANTILINRADSLGLAQLYQLRGRVGRSQQRAYAYLLIPSEGAVTEDAKKRLEVIQRFVELGSGFSVASHDLEIRGGGDLLGAQQSGHIAAVGFDLYTELLEEAIQEIEGKPQNPEDSRREPEIKAPFPAFLADTYVPDVHQRLSLYRRFSAASRDSEIDQLEEELRDRFGGLPLEAQNLMWLIRLKTLLKRIGIDALTVGPERVSMVPAPGSRVDPARVIALIAGKPAHYQLTPDSKFVAKVPTGSLRDLFFALESLFKDLIAA